MLQFSKSSRLTLLLLPGVMACSKPAEEKTAGRLAGPAPVAVQVQAVGTTTGVADQTYSGTIEAENTANLAFTVAGSVRRVLVREGDQVSKGQLLAELNPEEYASVLAGADASLLEARDQARRSQQLFKAESLTERELVQANAGLQRAVANAQVARKHMADTYLRAPFAGLISAKMVEPGVSAMPGAPAFSLIKTEQVFARAVVPEAEIGRMVPGHGRAGAGAGAGPRREGDGAGHQPGGRRDFAQLRGEGAAAQPRPAPVAGDAGQPADCAAGRTRTVCNVVAVAPQLVVQEADGASVVYVADAA